MTSNDATPNPSIDGKLLYHEVCGFGPVVLLVPGTPGDAGHFNGLGARRPLHGYHLRPKGHLSQPPPGRMVNH